MRRGILVNATVLRPMHALGSTATMFGILAQASEKTCSLRLYPVMMYSPTISRLTRLAGAACALALVLFDGRADAQTTRAPPEDFRPLLPPDDVPFEAVRPAPRLDSSVAPDTTTVFVPPVSPPSGEAPPDWTPQGPGPIFGAQVENIETFSEGIIEDNAVGPVNVLLTHPDDENILIAGAANGGIWQRDLLNIAPPLWRPLTDDQFSLSIGAIDFDPFDPFHETIVAGFGRTSGFGGVGGLRAGLIRTTDGGATWTVVGPDAVDPRFTADLAGANVRGLAVRGATLVVAVDAHDIDGGDNTGIFRSTDNGATFVRDASLGDGRAVGFAKDPADPQTLYTAIAPLSGGGGAEVVGVFRSLDTGATWTEISDDTIRSSIAPITANGGTRDIGIAIGPEGTLYVAIVTTRESGTTSSTQLSGVSGVPGIFRSVDGGATWQFFTFPGTPEQNPDPAGSPQTIDFFLNPIEPGEVPFGQARMPFALFADPVSAGVVYFGGDRQPIFDEPVLRPVAPDSVTNFVDATDFSGRLFRANFSSASEWGPFEHLTHRARTVEFINASGQPDSEVVGGTANVSAPHADTRDFAFGFTNDLFAGDDGGVYMRTSPTSRFGRWVSVNDDLQIAELHVAEWARGSETIVGATVNNGIAQQLARDGLGWESLLGGTGGGLAVDNATSPQNSYRFICMQNFGSFRMAIYSAANQLVFQSDPLTPEEIDEAAGLAGAAAFTPRFVTPIAVNANNACRVAIADDSRIFILPERGVPTGSDDVVTVTEPIPVSPDTELDVDKILFGGIGPDAMADPTDFRDGLMYVAASPRLFFSNEIIDDSGNIVSLNPLQEILPQIPTASGPPEIRDMVLDPREFRRIYVATSRAVFLGDIDVPGGGDPATAVWSDITGNLSFVGNIHAIDYLECRTDDILIVGADLGVYISLESDGFETWFELGQALPNAPVMDLDVDRTKLPFFGGQSPPIDVLTAGTLGRGAFVFEDLCSAICPDANTDCGLQPPPVSVDITPQLCGSTVTADEAGSATAPFTSFETGVRAQLPGGLVVVHGGTFNEAVTIDTPLRITATDGPARIGGSS